MLLKKHTHKQALENKETRIKAFFCNLLYHNVSTYFKDCPSIYCPTQLQQGQQHNILHNIPTATL